MTKPVCCFFLALGLAACAPKAVVVEDPVTPAATGRKPTRTGTAPAETQEKPAPLVNQNSGMRHSDLAKRLPDKRDMVPTAPVPAGGGSGGVTTSPPTADKRND